MARVKVGEVFKYYAKPQVAAIRLTDGAIKVGDEIEIQGATTEIAQTVESMEIEREQIQDARMGQEVGILVKDRVRPGDAVYRVG